MSALALSVAFLTAGAAVIICIDRLAYAVADAFEAGAVFKAGAVVALSGAGLAAGAAVLFVVALHVDAIASAHFFAVAAAFAAACAG